MLSRATLDALRAQIEEDYEGHGTLHRLLSEWKRVDDDGIPGGGELYESPPIALGSFDDALLRNVVHLDRIGLAFAQEEARIYFVDPRRSDSAGPGAELDRAIGSAISRVLAYGFDAAVWVNIDDEEVAEASGAIVDPQPTPTRDGWWHRRRVITTTLVRRGGGDLGCRPRRGDVAVSRRDRRR